MTRVSFTTLFQHSISKPIHNNQTRRRNKIHTNQKKGRKAVITCRHQIVYKENPIGSIEKLLDLINEFGKVVG